MTNYLVQANGLVKHFGHTRAVDGVSLQINSGEIYGLVGSDGAGKTTTMRLLVGALLPDEGSVNVCGFDVLKQTEEARSTIGYLSQRFSMYEDLTVLENIRFFAEVRGLSSSEWLPRSMEILDFVGLGKFKDRRAGQLSGGMKQKLGWQPRLSLVRACFYWMNPPQALTLSPDRIFGNWLLSWSGHAKVMAYPSLSPPPTWTKPHAVIALDS